ncbi:MAG: S41 family peptidase [Rikenellaceae bacterium]|nr:S41 family peptidase [Rikenellaceae bacterium]
MKIIKYGLLLFSTIICGTAAVKAEESRDFKIAKNLEILFNLYREINTNYVDEVDPEIIMLNSAEGMLKDLDPYTEFLSEDDLEDFEILTTGKYGGIGALIRKDGEWVEITQPYRGFPADKAGLKAGDQIVAIDGEDMRGAESGTVSSLMKGEPGTTFTLTVKKFDSGEVQDLRIKREIVTIPGVPYYGMIEDSIGYINHESFSEDCSTEIRNAFNDLKQQGMTSLIIDLRNNGGGIMQEAVKIVSMFVPKGSEVVSIRGKAQEMEASSKTTTEPLDTDIKIGVLINRGSASASEIVAGALQDMDRAVIIGQRSFGKGLVQSPRPLGYNAFVKITTAKYYIPSGRCVQAIDYSHVNEDGSVGYIPDSLIREFHTLNGRKVYDGGGIMPDVKVPVENISIFTINLYTQGYLEEFALEYIRDRGFTPVDEENFRLSDEDYRRFIDFMKDREVRIESETKYVLETLRNTAEKEKYDERIKEYLDKIEVEVSKEKEAELLEFKDEISRIIEDNIILYYYYSEGVVRHKLTYDPTVLKAVDILNDSAEYRDILTNRDTDRK